LILFQKCPLAPPQGEYRIFASNLYFFSPRTESTKSSSVYVLPLPVLDTSFGTSESIDDENKENNQPLANIKMMNTNPMSVGSSSSSNMAQYKEEDEKLANELHSKIAAHISDFNQYLSTI